MQWRLTTPSIRQLANIRRVHDSCCSHRSWMRIIQIVSVETNRLSKDQGKYTRLPRTGSIPYRLPHSRGRIYHHQIILSDSEVGIVASLLVSYLQSTISQVTCPTLIEKRPVVSSAPLIPVLQYETTRRYRSRPVVHRTHAPHSSLVCHTVAMLCNPPGLVLAV